MRGWTAMAWCLVPVLLSGGCRGASNAEGDAARPVVVPPTGAAASEPAPPVEGGVVTVGSTDEPDALNPWVTPAEDAAAMVTRPALATLWRVRPDGTYEPWLLAGEPSPTGGDQPFAVNYRLRADAHWSDGQPIDGGDVLFTLGLCQRIQPQVRSRERCDEVDLARSRADGRQVTVTFDRPYAAWRTLLATLPVLPEHHLRGADVRSAWRTRLPVSSGPFRFESWIPGERLTLVRNDRWWGPPATLDRLVFRFDAGGGVAPVADGDVDVAMVDATLEHVERARIDDRLRVAVAPSDRWEALDFNVGSPRLARRDVRRAVAAVLDRRIMLAELIAPVAPTTQPRNRILDGPPPRDDARAASVPSEAAAVDLDDVSCVASGDGVLVCDGEPMRLTLVTEGDGWQHDLVGEYVRQQLGAAGVAVEVRRGGATAEDWDLRVTAIGSRGDPVADGERWRCDVTANTQAYCNPALDDLLDRAERTPDPDERAALVGRADQLLAQDRPTHPLYDVPALLTYRATVRGPTVHPGPWQLTWNTEEWARTAD